MATEPRPFWFVGASYDDRKEDQTKRFLEEGIWQNGHEEMYHEKLLSMQAGDRIALKSRYRRTKELPFDNKNKSVSVMGIKAIGVIKRNHNDGKIVDVNWEPLLNPIREWYFHTNQRTVWQVSPSDWKKEGLIKFAFEGEPQDINRFRNSPYWQKRFGDVPIGGQQFKWIPFYEAVADKLLPYKDKDKRSDLLAFIKQLANEFNFSYINNAQLDDICPFTTLGLFNRQITDKNRTAVAKSLANFLGVTEEAPKSFESIPLLNNLMSMFFAPKETRQPDDIQSLWDFFSKAIDFSNEGTDDTRQSFSQAYDKVSSQLFTGRRITTGLYWIRPWSFLTLDKFSRDYIEGKLNIEIGRNGHQRRCSGEDYLSLLDELELCFQEDDYPVHSFPELALKGYTGIHAEGFLKVNDSAVDEEQVVDNAKHEYFVEPAEPYTTDDIIADGCFLDIESIKQILTQLKTKKNLILQGPPGTGKTWLAKRLAFALIGQKKKSAVRAVQFHPNLSYEDFIRGWRPAYDGRLELVDGPLLKMIARAKENKHADYVVVIEEINRGNPTQIFGEMLTLLEADKRKPSEALKLSYSRDDSEEVYVPDNLYVIGTMNIADRSLALVDLALRRRFAFYNLKP
ncbi:MAG: McrB family protein, partial [Candidatus Oxydemutatoraceae bacterium WSBS_2016_MAG_OTU14]